tara:strand:+ start:2338 stop:3567 length:1230 start_codon:yes stop_codon:yes gene_type:complete
MIYLIIILIVLILLSAFFSGVETALISINGVKVKSLRRRRKRGSKALFRIKQNPHNLIITILIGNNVVNIGAASLATFLFMDIFGSQGVGIATGVMTFLILVFGEITPKTFAVQNAERISLFVARPIEILSFILFPFVKLFEFISKFMSKLLGSKKEKELSESELRTMVSMGRQEGIISKEAAEMMHNVIKFEKTKVKEIMTLKQDVEMMDESSSLKSVLNFIVKSPYSRYPIYKQNKNNVVGVIDIDDVLRYVKNKKLYVKLKNLMRPAYYVSENKEIDDVLSELEGRMIPLAIARNNKKNFVGIISVEDILEEIVGDIFDKSREREADIKKINNKITKVDGKVSVEKVNRVLKLGFEEKHFDTIASFVEHKLKKIPKRGDRIKLKRAIIEVDKIDDNHVRNVKIIKK